MTCGTNRKVREEFEREAARRYWAIKEAGTIEKLADELGITKPTLIRYGNKWRSEKENAASPSTASGNVSTSEDASA